jgi:hypothetical protein
MRRAAAAALSMLFTALLLGCSTREGAHEPGSAARTFLGDPAVEILRGAERMESFRVQRELGALAPGTEALAGLKLLARGPELTPPQRELLRELVFDDASYQLEIAKACEPMPGVLIRAWSGERFVDLALCFECSMWGVGVQSAADAFPPRWEDFDPIARRLAALAKELFASDPAIQKLR